MCPSSGQPLLARSWVLTNQPLPTFKGPRGVGLLPKNGASTSTTSHQHQPYPGTSNVFCTGDKRKTTPQQNQKFWHQTDTSMVFHNLSLQLKGLRLGIRRQVGQVLPGLRDGKRQWVSQQGKLLQLQPTWWMVFERPFQDCFSLA